MKAGNNTEDMNLDKLNIKSHLNASLEFSNISVSEELIQKTLRAINEEPSTLVEKDENVMNTRKIPWNSYVRRLTGVAAALIILIGGYSIIKNSVGMKSSKKDSNGSMENSISMDMVQPEAKSQISEDNQVLFSATDRGLDNVDLGTTENTTLTKEEELKMDVAAAGDDSNENGYGIPSSPNLNSETSDERLESVRFTQIFQGMVDQIESIIITDEAAGKSVIITEELEISKVYSLLDSYLYSAAESGLSSDIYYAIEIKEKQSDDIDTITIGDTVTISSEAVKQDSTQAYEMINLEKFNRELKILIESNSN